MTLAELEALRAAHVDDGTLPMSTTRDELAAHQARGRELDRRLRQAQTAQATLDALADPDPLWHAHLEAWRETLCSELLALPPRIRDVKLLGVQRNVTLSIKTIDVGPSVLNETGYSLPSLRLGELMVESGYAVEGADPDRNFLGTLPWHGSLRDVERKGKDVARRRAQAEDQLADALMDDAERAERDAERAEGVRALNALHVKVGLDGKTLRVVNRHNEDVDEATLTPLQRKALADARKVFAEAQAARLAAALGG